MVIERPRPGQVVFRTRPEWWVIIGLTALAIPGVGALGSRALNPAFGMLRPLFGLVAIALAIYFMWLIPVLMATTVSTVDAERRVVESSRVGLGETQTRSVPFAAIRGVDVQNFKGTLSLRLTLRDGPPLYLGSTGKATVIQEAEAALREHFPD